MTSLTASVFPSFTNPSATSLRPPPSSSSSSPSSPSSSHPSSSYSSSTSSIHPSGASNPSSWDYNVLEEWLSVHDSLVVSHPQPSNHVDEKDKEKDKEREKEPLNAFFTVTEVLRDQGSFHSFFLFLFSFPDSFPSFVLFSCS